MALTAAQIADQRKQVEELIAGPDVGFAKALFFGQFKGDLLFPYPTLPAAARAHLGRIPVILLDAPDADTELTTAVRFTTAVYAVHRPGTAYRMDEVPVPLRVILPTDYPSDGEVLAELLKRV